MTAAPLGHCPRSLRGLRPAPAQLRGAAAGAARDGRTAARQRLGGRRRLCSAARCGRRPKQGGRALRETCGRGGGGAGRQQRAAVSRPVGRAAARASGETAARGESGEQTGGREGCSSLLA